MEDAFEFSVDLSKFHIESTPYWKRFSNLKSESIFYAKNKNPTLVSKGIILNTSKEVIIERTIFQEEYLNALCSNHFIVFRKLLPKIKASKIIPFLNYLDNNNYHRNMETLL